MILSLAGGDSPSPHPLPERERERFVGKGDYKKTGLFRNSLRPKQALTPPFLRF